MDKRGDAKLLLNVIIILMYLFAAGNVFAWESGQATGKSIKTEVVAKQVVLMIDSAKPGAVIFIDSEIEINGNIVTAKFENQKSEYSFFSKNKVSARKVEGGTEIRIT
jgi:uncharacterized protein (UPF0333 family)